MPEPVIDTVPGMYTLTYMKDSAVNRDHVQTVEKARLRTFLGTLSRDKMARVCQALAIAAGCAG
jgi:mRNA-degrading endonuclease toxin of MazEF toxin-antitoxin module